MQNPNFILDNLEQDLIRSGVSEDRAMEIRQLAANEINNAVFEVVQQHVAEAEETGRSMGANAFLNEVKLFSDGVNFRIDTTSGEIDFTEPPFPMLPRLLKNAKTAKDGSHYKTIPIPTAPTSNVPRSSMEGAQRRQQEINVARAAMKDGDRDALSMSSIFANNMAPIGSDKTYSKTKSTGPVKFRTASDKQDPHSSWVRPGKSLSMDTVLSNINGRMQSQIEEVIATILNKYGV